jgi:hypothetical protein
MKQRTRSHAVALSAALLSIAASVASACGSSSPALGRPDDDSDQDGAVETGGGGNEGSAPGDSQVGSDGSDQGDVGATEGGGDDALDDVVNPYQDAFETYDAASDTSITTEGDSSTHADGSGIHDAAGPLPDGAMIVGD